MLHNKKSFNLFLKLFLLLIFISNPTVYSRGCEIPLVVGGAGMGATIGCGGGAVAGSSLGPVGVLCGFVIGGLIGLLAKKCARRVETKYDKLWFNDSSGEANKVPTKTVEDIISESQPGEEKQFCKQFIKKGGYKEALEDFESLGLLGIKDMPRGKVGKVGTLSDGRTVNVRIESLDKRPTLEIQPLKRSEKTIKIRYGTK